MQGTDPRSLSPALPAIPPLPAFWGRLPALGFLPGEIAWFRKALRGGAR